jgi:DNA-directed RNA polymerase specialized sigma24 family protein
LAAGSLDERMNDDTSIGGAGHRFPATHHSAVQAARGDDPAAKARGLELLVAAYWKPSYKYIRIRWRKSNEDAKDLTQAFFARALEKDFFSDYDPARASFRTFLRVCLDGFVANELKAANRVKRGGGQSFVPLDFDEAALEFDRQPAADDVPLDEYFYREWARSLFALAVDRLRADLGASGKRVHFEIFARYDLAEAGPGGRPTYAALATDLGVSATDVTNYLALARREFRRTLLAALRDVTGSEQEFQDEARRLLGVEGL